MRCRVTTLGGYEEYGTEKVVAELDVGPVKVHEMELDSADEITRLLQEEDVNSVEFEADPLSGYDAHLTVICDDVL